MDVIVIGDNQMPRPWRYFKETKELKALLLQTIRGKMGNKTFFFMFY